MNYIVVGCGRIGAELAQRLYKRGHRVSVIDRDEAAFNNLAPDFRGRTIEGEGLEKEVLHRAGIEQADGLVAVTNSDSINAVVAYVARTVYNIQNVVVRCYDSRQRVTHEAFDLQVISPSSWGAQRLEELLYHAQMHTVFSAGNGEVEVYEFVVPGEWHGKPLGAYLPTGQCVLVALTRTGKAMLPSPETIAEKGDIVHLGATLEGIRAVCQKLSTSQEGVVCLY